LFIKDNSAYRKYLTNPDEFDYIQEENRIIAIPKQHTATLLALKESLKVVSMGIELGEIKGKDFIPSHALAMSSRLNREVFTERELDYDEAISYLRREAISIPDAPRGFLLLTYKNQPLGFVKNIGNRANNLYPDKWRIRT
ncbi:MAG: RsmF rRNA methyltransferase first C-terminal domain-containing protein, partial [Fermentimonas sp.]